MKRIFFFFCFTIVLISLANCNQNQHQIKKTENNKNTNFQELINFEENDIPYFWAFSYSTAGNCIFAPLRTEDLNLNKMFLKLDINRKSKNYNFYLLGEPGQCPECTNYIVDLNVSDGFVIAGISAKGYNFYNLDGEFIFQIFSYNTPLGKGFIIENQFIALPSTSSNINDYAIYVFDITSKKLIKKMFPKKDFLNLFNISNEQEKIIKRKKITSVRNYIIDFQYVVLQNRYIVIFANNIHKKNELPVIDITTGSAKKIKLKRYCSFISKTTPKAPTWGAITRQNNNIVIVRLLGMRERKEIKNKYSFLLFELNIKGNLLNIYAPPSELLNPTTNTFANVKFIVHIEKNKFITHEIDFINSSSKKNVKKHIDHIVLFQAKRLNKKETKWILKQLSF